MEETAEYRVNREERKLAQKLRLLADAVESGKAAFVMLSFEGDNQDTIDVQMAGIVDSYKAAYWLKQAGESLVARHLAQMRAENASRIQVASAIAPLGRPN